MKVTRKIKLQKHRESELQKWRMLKIAVGISLLMGLVATLLIHLDRIRGITPDRVVTVYRTHGCLCAFSWRAELEREGFIVRLWESETLDHSRRRLRATDLTRQGCHVASYLDYFLEGHVAPSVIRRIAKDRPSAIGFEAIDGDTHAGRQHSKRAGGEVLLIDASRHYTSWHQPNATEGRTDD